MKFHELAQLILTDLVNPHSLRWSVWERNMTLTCHLPHRLIQRIYGSKDTMILNK